MENTNMLNNLICVLETKLDDIYLHKSMLTDIKEKLDLVVADIEVKSEECSAYESLFLKELSRETRILSNLMHFVMQGFNKDFEAAEKVKDYIYLNVGKQSKL